MTAVRQQPSSSSSSRSPPCCPLERTRYYYTAAQRFEQSVDVYRPIVSEHHVDNLIVVLVVGSGWMGHCAWIYRLTSWWNASGPATVARALHAPCICVRHRGAFFQVPSSVPSWWLLILLGPVGAGTVLWYQAYYAVGGMSSTDRETIHDPIAVWLVSWTLFLSLVVAAYTFFQWSARGSASLDDMLDDVATALEWVEQHKHTTTILFPSTSANDNGENNSNTNTTTTVRIMFGGYSSGGHVALTLLSRPDIWQQHPTLRPAQELLSGILLISGVLTVEPVDPWKFRQHISTQPAQNSDYKPNQGNNNTEDRIGVTDITTATCFSSSETDDSISSSSSSPALSSNAATIATATTTPPPVWLSRFVMRVVWGPHWATTIPSPLLLLTGDDNSKKVHCHLPHLVIQNRSEVFFGLRWLDAFFCAREYCQLLRCIKNRDDQGRRAPVIFCEVDSDHWFILASRQLHDAVQEHLPRLWLESGPCVGGNMIEQ